MTHRPHFAICLQNESARGLWRRCSLAIHLFSQGAGINENTDEKSRSGRRRGETDGDGERGSVKYLELFRDIGRFLIRWPTILQVLMRERSD